MSKYKSKFLTDTGKTDLYGGCSFRAVYNQLPEKDRHLYVFAKNQEEKDEI